jgi:pimeloyl-ACP methyl ester carboxylesterase
LDPSIVNASQRTIGTVCCAHYSKGEGMSLQLFLFFISFMCSSLLQAKTIVFLNGGPGFNSEPERNILTPYLNSKGHEAFFWDEPSQLRPQNGSQSAGNAFAYATENASLYIKKICDDKYALQLPCELTLVGHSFAVHYIVRLSEKHSDSIKELILISPAINMEDPDKNIFQLAVKGLMDEGHPETSAELAALIPSVSEAFDQTKIQAYTLASQYASLFLNYWGDLNLMQQYFSHLKGEFSFDPSAFFAVRQSLPLVNQDPFFKISIPTQIYFGAADPVVLVDQQLPLLKKYFTSFDIHILAGVRHYPHIERMLDLKY